MGPDSWRSRAIEQPALDPWCHVMRCHSGALSEDVLVSDDSEVVVWIASTACGTDLVERRSERTPIALSREIARATRDGCGQERLLESRELARLSPISVPLAAGARIRLDVMSSNPGPSTATATPNELSGRTPSLVIATESVFHDATKSPEMSLPIGGDDAQKAPSWTGLACA